MWAWSLGREDPLEEEMATQVFLLEKPYGQRSLVGYSPLSLKESDTTEHTHMFFHCHILLKYEIASSRSKSKKQMYLLASLNADESKSITPGLLASTNALLSNFSPLFFFPYNIS